jgi:hypothetical protein
MSELVGADEIEDLVGYKRHVAIHVGRAESETGTLYILHSKECKSTTPDLRECPYSIAMDRGINMSVWRQFMDIPVMLVIEFDHLVPMGKLSTRKSE